MKHRLIYWLAYAGMYLLASLPFGALYALSDFMYLLLRYVFRYRLQVVRTNLKNSFPDKSDAELKEIERKFYHYICDYAVEEVKTLRITADEMKRRMLYENPDDVVEMMRKHTSVFVMMPHYGSFEWMMGLALAFDEGVKPLQVYKPLRNKYLDALFIKIRSRFGGTNVPKHSTARTLIKLYRSGQPFVVGLISDQSPNKSEAHYWTTFLNQDTVFMDGGEKLAQLLRGPVFYTDIRRLRRGYCTVRFELITEHPEQTAPGEITESFARHLEKTIRRDPPYWFWSHKRWKLRREDVVRNG